MSKQLLDNLNEIKNQKDTYLLPGNIKKDVTVLGITGTYEGVMSQTEYDTALATSEDILGNSYAISNDNLKQILVENRTTINLGGRTLNTELSPYTLLTNNPELKNNVTFKGEKLDIKDIGYFSIYAMNPTPYPTLYIITDNTTEIETNPCMMYINNELFGNACFRLALSFDNYKLWSTEGGFGDNSTGDYSASPIEGINSISFIAEEMM